MGECLNRHYVRTKFRPNPRGSGIFCVDLTWNDPKKATKQLYICDNGHIDTKPLQIDHYTEFPRQKRNIRIGRLIWR